MPTPPSSSNPSHSTVLLVQMCSRHLLLLSDTGTTELGRTHVLCSPTSSNSPCKGSQWRCPWAVHLVTGRAGRDSAAWPVHLGSTTAWLTPSFEGFYLIKDLACTLANQRLPNLSLRWAKAWEAGMREEFAASKCHSYDVCLAWVTKS